MKPDNLRKAEGYIFGWNFAKQLASEVPDRQRWNALENNISEKRLLQEGDNRMEDMAWEWWVEGARAAFSEYLGIERTVKILTRETPVVPDYVVRITGENNPLEMWDNGIKVDEKPASEAIPFFLCKGKQEERVLRLVYSEEAPRYYTVDENGKVHYRDSQNVPSVSDRSEAIDAVKKMLEETPLELLS